MAEAAMAPGVTSVRSQICPIVTGPLMPCSRSREPGPRIITLNIYKNIIRVNADVKIKYLHQTRPYSRIKSWYLDGLDNPSKGLGQMDCKKGPDWEVAPTQQVPGSGQAANWLVQTIRGGSRRFEDQDVSEFGRTNLIFQCSCPFETEICKN